MSIPSTKPYLPNRKRLNKYIDRIYDSGWLTNNGPLVNELTQRLEELFESDHILLVANGTLALQIAYQTLINPVDDKTSPIEAITTPFTFIATSNALKWEGITPIFTDINPTDWCLSANSIAEKINKNTQFIVPVHVFGNTCQIEEINEMAQKYALKTIYDASHAFAINYKGKNIVQYGDASIISFHATKLFHTIEGAMIRFKNRSDLERAQQIANFGFNKQKEPCRLGINAKMNEFEAAVGLAILDDIPQIITERGYIADMYQNQLSGNPIISQLNRTHNNAYMPVLFNTETQLLTVLTALKSNNIEAKRYFYPSLDKIEHLNKTNDCAVSQNISNRILCLPMYNGLDKKDVVRICNIINNAVNTDQLDN
jgi:dTDP-4-amino-4,6-dideoxygalactose transaminase